MGTRSIRQPRRAKARASDAGESTLLLTAGDLARLLDVDLKTIHNWVKQGHVSAHRTEGRHLRFQRVQVVRFLRRFGHPVPQGLGVPSPRVLVHRERGERRSAPLGVKAAERVGIVAVALELASGQYEVVVLELDCRELALTRELVNALRDRPDTKGLALVGLSRDPSRRRDFLVWGGDVALAARPADVTVAIRWLTGGAPTLPRGALCADWQAARAPSRR